MEVEDDTTDLEGLKADVEEETETTTPETSDATNTAGLLFMLFAALFGTTSVLRTKLSIMMKNIVYFSSRSCFFVV